MKNMFRYFITLFVLIIGLNITFATGQNNKEVLKIKTSAVCGMCKDRIEKNIAFEKGVSEIALDIKTKVATITYNPKKTNPDNIKHAISKLGYDADEVKADKIAYNKLPGCCKNDLE
jgi:periplasmic mercuric ion binding protein